MQSKMLHSYNNAHSFVLIHLCCLHLLFPFKGKEKKVWIIKVQMLHMLYNTENNFLNTINLPSLTIKYSVMLIDFPMELIATQTKHPLSRTSNSFSLEIKAPLLLYHVMLGSGFPTTGQVSVFDLPCSTQ